MTKDDALLRHSLGDTFGLPEDDDAIFDDLMQDLTLVEIGVGETLMTEGDPSDALYVLLQGRLYASVGTGEDEVFIGEIRRGETIGEVGIIMDAPRGATVRATRASTVARLSAEALLRLMAAYPTLSLTIARTLITRSKRDAGPRHPGFVPETLCLFKVSPGVDLPRVAETLAANTSGETAIVTEQDDASAARAAIHEAERAGKRVLILADGKNADWLSLAVSEADEVVRIVDSRGVQAATELEAGISRGPGAVLPRHTLLLIHPDDTQSPRGTRHWLAGRQIDRHLHLRLGNADDRRRVGRLLSGRGVGIVFAGGAARGAAHLGAIRALNEAGVEFDIIGGTSIGAGMAAWYAMGLRETALEREACKVFVDGGGPTNDWNLLPMISLVKGKRTKDRCILSIRDTSGGDIDIEDTWIPFFCIAANYTAQEEAVLDRGPLWQALQASYAIPGVLPPVLIDGEIHVDGGVMNNLPVDALERAGAAATIAIDLLGGRRKKLDFDELPGTAALLRDKFRPRRKRKYKIPGILSMLFNSTVLSSLTRQREMAARATLCLNPVLPRLGLLEWDAFPQTIENGYASFQEQIKDLPEDLMARLRGQAG